MSTKIHDGLKIEQIPGRTVFTVADEIRKVMHEALRRQSLEENSRAMRALLTGSKPDDETSQPDRTFVDFMTHLLVKQKDEDEFDLAFMLFEVPGKDYWLGNPIGRHSHLVAEELRELEGIHDWSYWDNTDQPNDVSDDEWVSREKDWDVVGYGPVIDYGLCIRISSFYSHPVNYLTMYTSEERVTLARQVFGEREKLAERAAFEALFAKVIQALPEDHDLQPFGIYMDVRDASTKILGENPGVVTVPDYDIDAIIEGQEFETVQAHISDDLVTEVVENITN